MFFESFCHQNLLCFVIFVFKLRIVLRKKTGRIFHFFLLWLLRLVFILFLILSSGKIQTWIAGHVIDFMAEKFEINLSIEQISLKLPNRVHIENIYLPAENGDTLIYSKEIIAKISSLKLKQKRIIISEILLEQPEIFIESNKNNVYNFQYILDKFQADSSREKTRNNFDVYCNTFRLGDARFQMKNMPFTESPGVFNSSDLLVNGFNIGISNFKMHGDSIQLIINELSFKEKSGIELQKLNAGIMITDSVYQLSNIFIKTGHSMLHAPLVEMVKLDTSINNIWEDIKVHINIDSSFLSIEDAAYFVSSLKGMDQKVNMSAKIDGKLSDIKLSDFHFAYGKDTRIDANLSINGLPNIEQSFIFGQINTLSVSPIDAQSIYLPPFENKKTIKLPELIREIGKISYKGDVVGMFNDLVATGKFNTNYGNISTDLAIVSHPISKDLTLNGDLSIESVHLGKLLKKDVLGIVDLSSKLKGQIDTMGNYSFSMSTNVNRFDFKDYPYSKIDISGKLTNESFDGELYANDPNLKIEFMGGYVLKNDIPDIDFRADISANLDELNLDTTDTEAGLLLLADFNGNQVENLIGTLKLTDIYYRKESETVKMNYLNFNSLKILDEQILEIKSDYFNISSSGAYNLNPYISSLKNLIYYYFPVLTNERKNWLAGDYGNVKLSAEFFNLNRISAFLLPQINIPETVSLEADINANTDIYSLNIHCSKFAMDSIMLNNVSIGLNADKNALDFDVEFDYMDFQGYPIFDDMKIHSSSINDSIQLSINWDNYDEIRYAGNMNTTISLQKTIKDKIAVSTHIYPSDFTLRSEIWQMDESNLYINNRNIEVGNLRFYNNEQMIRLVGDISEDKDKDIRYYIQNFDISLFNRFLSKSGFELNGRFNSNGRLADPYGDINFKSFLEIADLYVNEEEFGQLQVNANWDNLSNAVRLDGNSRFVDFRGFANPVKDSLNISLNMNNFGLELVQPYLINAGLLEIKGRLDGSLYVSGKISSPDIYGALDFDRAGLTYDMLMARFNLEDSIFVYTDSLVLKNFLISDEKNGTGVIQGKFTHNMFKNIKYDFDINLDNYHILNTSEIENSTYYGSAYATATANISGSNQDITISIPDAITEKNTVFVLPMSDSYEANDEPWITFLKDSVTESNLQDMIPKTPFDVTFLMDLQVTPDAEARLVFDPKVGDMIRANCLGNLAIEVYPDGSFAMKGDLEVKGGDYLFTLQNVINKRFVIEDGGTISWNGDPLDGTLDIKAAYKLKAPLYDIMVGLDTSDVYKRRTEVSCIMKMSGSLMSPDIEFDIEVPNADEKAKTRVASLSKDEINKQVLTLLVLNRFYTPDDLQMGTENRSSNIAGVTSFELLSNQLSNWLSQISDDFDIGVNYRPGDEITSQELEVALSTQILNDRVLINGNVGVGEHENTTSDIVGDVEVQVKVNKSGNLRVKGFTRANSQSQLDYDYGPYTQGVGLFYTESFNTIPELLIRYFKTITFQQTEEEDK
jgi:hypothetical protein